MPSARDEILRDVRRNLPVEAPLPELVGDFVSFVDPARQFLETLRSVGGAGVLVPGRDALRRELEQLAGRVEAKRICSALPEVIPGDVDLAAVDDPHDLADVDLAILPGELAVAENAAVWVTGARVPQRVAYFLSQHVALVVPAGNVASNMHEAYRWLHAHADSAAPFVEPRWGTFLSGPSKTADIEQALVIGAHGACSLHVFLTT